MFSGLESGSIESDVNWCWIQSEFKPEFSLLFKLVPDTCYAFGDGKDGQLGLKEYEEFYATVFCSMIVVMMNVCIEENMECKDGFKPNTKHCVISLFDINIADI